MNLSIHLAIAFLVGLVSASIARRRGRNQYLWFGIGFLFGVLGLLAIFFAPLPGKKKQLESNISKIELHPYIDGPIDRFWYYLDEKRLQQGPISHNALTQAWKKGLINLSTLVWHEELSNWKQLRELIKES